MAVSGLGHRLAAVRNMARLSQEEMSQALGISRSAYQNYERGQRDLTAQLLLEVYEKFDVDPLWMLEGDSEAGKNRRHEQIASANRKIGVAVERRIIERGLTVTPEKKWDAIDFLFDEFLNTDSFANEGEGPDTTRIDSVLRLVS